MAARFQETRALPQELVQRVYSVGMSIGVKHQALDLKDRLRGLAVCRTWLAALSHLPIPAITLYNQAGWDTYSPTNKLCQWIVKKQPTVTNLHQESQQDLSIEVIHSLQQKGLLKLTWSRTAVDIRQGLPTPGVFPNLQYLEVQRLLDTTDWLAGLGALSKLECLKLRIDVRRQVTAAAPVQLPPLARLTSLRLEFDNANDSRLPLADLPTLAELEVKSYGSVAIVSSGPATQLQHLTCLTSKLSADFSALPALRSIGVQCRTQLDPAASIAAATALTRLELLDCHVVGHNISSVHTLLRSLPPSVSCLHLEGQWSGATAAVVGELPSLVALSMKYTSPEGRYAPMPHAGATFWARLRSFSWHVHTVYDDYLDIPKITNGLTLPQALQQASNLEALQANLATPNVFDLDLIASLPALRKVNFPLSQLELGDEHYTAGRRLLQRALPNVAMHERADGLTPVEFFSSLQFDVLSAVESTWRGYPGGQ